MKNNLAKIVYHQYSTEEYKNFIGPCLWELPLPFPLVKQRIQSITPLSPHPSFGMGLQKLYQQLSSTLKQRGYIGFNSIEGFSEAPHLERLSNECTDTEYNDKTVF
jgi:hypothetical protein